MNNLFCIKRRAPFCILAFLMHWIARKRVLSHAPAIHYVRPASSRRPWNNKFSPYPRQYATRRRDYSSHILDYEEAQRDTRARFYRVDFRDRRPGKLSLTSKLIWMNVAAYALQVFKPSFTAWGIKRSELILQGRELYRVITPVFLHGGVGHLASNMYSLGNVGPDLEKLFGTGRYLSTYMLAGIAGNVMSAFQSPRPALGASGAVFGVIGAYTVFLKRNDWVMGRFGEQMNSRLLQTIMLNIGLGFVNPSIDNWGHIGGALGGACIAYYFGPRLYETELPTGARALVDRPILRLPRSIEQIPDHLSNLATRMSKRIRGGKPGETPPWQQPQRPRPDVPSSRSIRPKKS